MKGIPIFVLSSLQYAFIWNEFSFFLLLFREEKTEKRQVPISFPLCTLLFLSISCIFETLNVDTSGDHLPYVKQRHVFT